MDLKLGRLLETILTRTIIESRQNKQFKTWMKLKTKKYRDILGLFLAFDDDIIEKAADYGVIEERVTVDKNKNGILISKELMKELQTDTTFDSMAVCKKFDMKVKSDRILMVDDVQDPNNLGALLRSAAAFNFSEVFISNKSADLYHEKTIRSSKGAIFDVQVKRCDLLEVILRKKEEGYVVLCAEAHGENQAENKYEKLVLIMGNEGQGVSSEVKEMADYHCHIETQNVESLNVAVAGGILMYMWRCK